MPSTVTVLGVPLTGAVLYAAYRVVSSMSRNYEDRQRQEAMRIAGPAPAAPAAPAPRTEADAVEAAAVRRVICLDCTHEFVVGSDVTSVACPNCARVLTLA